MTWPEMTWPEICGMSKEKFQETAERLAEKTKNIQDVNIFLEKLYDIAREDKEAMHYLAIRISGDLLNFEYSISKINTTTSVLLIGVISQALNKPIKDVIVELTEKIQEMITHNKETFKNLITLSVQSADIRSYLKQAGFEYQEDLILFSISVKKKIEDILFVSQPTSGWQH